VNCEAKNEIRFTRYEMRILITSGGTREYIDPVRYISNASSGKMGYALAKAAFDAGHKVTLISASDLQPPVGMDFVGIESAQDMFNAVKEFFPKCDCLIMAAAVADYTPVRTYKSKIKRAGKTLTLKLKPTPDILKWAGEHKNERRATSDGPRIIVGFSLEDKNLRKNAEKKLKEKNLDMIIVNTPESIGSDETVIQIKVLTKSWIQFSPANKTVAAHKIIEMINVIQEECVTS
jgi:phosphopantothenoylcysteine decarboxylase/phosphopantothenate--cysteine ligase